MSRKPQKFPQTIQALVNTLGNPPELKDKITSWKRTHILVVRYRENRLALSCKFPPSWLAVKTPKGTEWAAGEKRHHRAC